MTLIGRPHQRGRAPQGLLGVDVGTAVEQKLDDGGVAGAGRHHERRFPTRTLFVRVGAGLEQALHDGEVPVETRQ